MDLKLIAGLDIPLVMVQGLPEGFTGPVLPGSHVMSCVKDFGAVVTQEWISGQYTIRFTILNFLQKITLLGSSKADGLLARLSLKNNILHTIKDTGTINLLRGQFMMLKTHGLDVTTEFEKQKEYRILDVGYSMDMVEQAMPFFPRLNEIITDQNRQKLQSWAGPKTLEVVEHLIQCPYEQNIRRFYFDNKIREYLFLLLTEAFGKPPVCETVSQHDTESVNTAKKILLQNLDDNLSIQDIARMVHMNVFQLKAAYKQIFGVSMFETLLQTRMQKAWELVHGTGKPLKEIATCPALIILPILLPPSENISGTRRDL